MVSWDSNNEEASCDQACSTAAKDPWGALPLDEPRPEANPSEDTNPPSSPPASGLRFLCNDPEGMWIEEQWELLG